MLHKQAPYEINDEQRYARVESIILDLQLTISIVRRANNCLDLDTVQRTRARAFNTLDNIEAALARFRPDASQTRRLAERRSALALLLREPSPVERLARTLRVG